MATTTRYNYASIALINQLEHQLNNVQSQSAYAINSSDLVKEKYYRDMQAQCLISPGSFTEINRYPNEIDIHRYKGQAPPAHSGQQETIKTNNSLLLLLC